MAIEANERDKPMQNGFIESFNGRLRDALEPERGTPDYQSMEGPGPFSSLNGLV